MLGLGLSVESMRSGIEGLWLRLVEMESLLVFRMKGCREDRILQVGMN